jgi:hypothetical protein
MQQVNASSFLFQNAKPGENIKISDILKKNANTFHIPQVFVEEEPTQFSNSKIQENMNVVNQLEEKESLAF